MNLWCREYGVGGMGPTNVFNRGKIITPVVLCFSLSKVFFQNFVFERNGIEEFWLYELHAFQGIAVLKLLMFKKKPIASNDVCLYTVLAVRVWLYKGGRYSPLTLKTNAWWWWLMRNTQFACVFQEKNGIHRSCSGKWNGLLVIVMILTCCERSKAHSRYTVSVMEKILISEFLDFWKYFLRAGRRSCTAKCWSGDYFNSPSERSNVAATTATVVACYKRIEKLLEKPAN